MMFLSGFLEMIERKQGLTVDTGSAFKSEYVYIQQR